jgi:hypothetical protein
MRYVTSTLVACSLAFAVNAFAQQQAPGQLPSAPQPPSREQAPPLPPAAAEPASKSTLTGCVTAAKTTDGGTAYVLSKAEGGSATMYVLGGTESNWAENVNKKVEVIGPVQEPLGGASSADSKVLRPPMVLVETVKVVAQTCS